MGIGSLPVQLGPERAAAVACIVMAIPQMIVALLLIVWGQTWHAAGVTFVLLAQIGLMRTLIADPRGRAPWYNGTGVVLYVSGMLIAAFALANLAGR
ncbi:MAG: hypothetical protein K2Y05_11595 [Hyphomicrobiaceae bacterium]|nr:hypothetical protein [Hyphomicrobiaceae bacterium]